MELNSAGGSVSVGYQIENPVEGAGLQVEGYADWLSVESATAGTLTPSTAYTAVAFGYADGVMTTTYIARSESITTLAN